MPTITIERGILSTKASVNLVLAPDGRTAQIVECDGERVTILYSPAEVASFGTNALKMAGVGEAIAAQARDEKTRKTVLASAK